MTFAVIPAAGHSSRMGRPKLALALGDRTLLEHAIGALREGGVRHVVVVVGPHVPDLTAIATAAGADVCPLPEPTPDMRSTVERGLQWLEERYHPAADDLWLLAPGDHPGFGPDIVRLLIDAGRAGHSIIVPVHGGRRGHPTAIAWKHVAGIRALPADQGINSYLRKHASDMLELDVAEPGVLLDVDTPEDYQRAVSGSGPPSPGRSAPPPRG